VIAETKRLRLREITVDDLDDLAALVADAEQMRFYPRPRTRDEASAWIERTRGAYREHGFGFWAVELRTRARFIGYCGIRPLMLERAAETELGWHIDKTYWNRGLATEAARAARDVAFGRFALRRLVAMIRSDNVPSCRVAEKIGLQREKLVAFEGDAYLIYAT
jgi:RimJ/RimL family protein N-acetyltransferase